MQHDAMRMQFRRWLGSIELANAWLELDGILSKRVVIAKLRNATWRFSPEWQDISGEHNVSVLAWAALTESARLEKAINMSPSGTHVMSRRNVINAKQLLVAHVLATGQARGEA